MATPTTAADTIAASVPYLAALANSVMSLSHTPPATVDKVSTALSAVQTGVTALAASQSAVQSAPIVDQIEAGGTAILQAVGPMAPFPYNIIAMVAGSMFTSSIEAVKLLLQHKVTVPALPTPLPVAA